MSIESKKKGSKKKVTFFSKDDFVVDGKKVKLKDKFFSKLPGDLTKDDVVKVYAYSDQYRANALKSASDYLEDGFSSFSTSINHGKGVENEDIRVTRKKGKDVVEVEACYPKTSLTSASLDLFNAANG